MRQRSVFAGPITQEERNRELSRQAKRGWGEWLESFPWDHYATLTFEEPRSPEAAVRAFHAWRGKLEGLVGHDIDWFYAVEAHASGAFHVHALLHDTKGLTIDGIRQAWGAGKTKVLCYEADLGVEYYVTKQIATVTEHYGIGHRTPRRPGLSSKVAQEEDEGSQAPSAVIDRGGVAIG